MGSDSSPQEIGFDTELLSDFIYELNIARRCGMSYPPGHPRIQASIQTVIDLLRQLLEFREKVTLGIARDVIVIDKFHLDKKNPVYRDYARSLFQLGIAALTIHKGLTAEEFSQINGILSLNREQVKERGGIISMLQAARFKQLEVQFVDYGLFQVRKERRDSREETKEKPKNQDSLWEDFVQGLLENTGVEPKTLEFLKEETGPAALAQILNHKASREADRKEQRYDRVIATYIQKILKKEGGPGERKKHLDQLSKFVMELNPNLRQLFLTDMFRSLALQKDFSPDSMPPFSEDLILEAFEKINSQSSYYLLILGLLQKLANHLGKGKASPVLKAKAEEKEQALAEKFNTLFRDFDLDLIMKKPYQAALQGLLAMESAPSFDSHNLEDLKKTLDSHSVDVQIFSIILEILESGLAVENMENLERNLKDLSGYFVQIGDFKALLDLYHKLKGISASSPDQKSPPCEVIQIFSTPKFIEDLLNGAAIWGKEKFPEIKTLILLVGIPFISPMLDRLAEESNITIKRFLLEVLSEVGSRARDHIVSRLQDRRWDFVTNLILLLRNQGDASVLPSIRALRNHEHPRVREEVLKTLLHFYDPDADRILLSDLQSVNSEILRRAIPFAGMSKNPLVFQGLLDLLQRSPCNAPGMEIKALVVRTLSKISNPAAFPHLEKTLQSRSIFHGRALNHLKAEVIRSIGSYAPEKSMDFLENLLKKKGKKFAPMISKTMARVRERSFHELGS